MALWRKVLDYVRTGLAFGFVVTTICLWTMNGMDDTLRQVAGWLAASVVYGLACLLFEAQALSLPVATLLHFAVCFGVTLTMGWLQGYAESLTRLLWEVGPVFVGIYAVIYIVCMVMGCRQAKKLSEKLGQ